MGRHDSWRRGLKRGEVWFVNFDPSVGGKIQKQRPAVIVSNDASNLHLNRVQVVPISSQVVKIYPSEAEVTLNGEARKAIADQLATVSKLHFANRAGRLSFEDMEKVEQVVKLQLGLK